MLRGVRPSSLPRWGELCDRIWAWAYRYALRLPRVGGPEDAKDVASWALLGWTTPRRGDDKWSPALEDPRTGWYEEFEALLAAKALYVDPEGEVQVKAEHAQTEEDIDFGSWVCRRMAYLCWGALNVLRRGDARRPVDKYYDNLTQHTAREKDARPDELAIQERRTNALRVSLGRCNLELLAESADEYGEAEPDLAPQAKSQRALLVCAAKWLREVLLVWWETLRGPGTECPYPRDVATQAPDEDVATFTPPDDEDLYAACHQAHLRAEHRRQAVDDAAESRARKAFDKTADRLRKDRHIRVPPLFRRTGADTLEAVQTQDPNRVDLGLRTLAAEYPDVSLRWELDLEYEEGACTIRLHLLGPTRAALETAWSAVRCKLGTVQCAQVIAVEV